MHKIQNVQLGCGMIRLGREWGYKPQEIPSESDAIAFLQKAFDLGITYYDTAPAYEWSELRLGKFLEYLTRKERSSITIATKCGELYDFQSNTTIVDHSYQSLVGSINKSLKLLNKIDILQIHKATPENLQSDDVTRAIKYAKSLGIKRFGASISDPHTADIVSKDPDLEVIQLPYNLDRRDMQQSIQALKRKNKIVVINRPFDMGHILYERGNKYALSTKAYEFILKEKFNGFILTGTANAEHLKENIKAFEEAQEIITNSH